MQNGRMYNGKCIYKAERALLNMGPVNCTSHMPVKLTPVRGQFAEGLRDEMIQESRCLTPGGRGQGTPRVPKGLGVGVFAFRGFRSTSGSLRNPGMGHPGPEEMGTRGTGCLVPERFIL